MSQQAIRVLSITGWCRNGSTILGNILNEVSGFFHVGELHFLWKNAYGNGSNTLCGCGSQLAECSIWSKVLEAELPKGQSPQAHAETVIRQQRDAVRTRHTWRVLKGHSKTTTLREHAATMARTYRAIADLTQCRVIVDSTKIPGESALLSHVEGITPLYLHLVRDPRAVAHSWMNWKDYAYPMSAVRSSAYWLGFNLASEAIIRKYPGQSLFLRYEDFIADPAGTVDTLLKLCGADGADNPVRGRAVNLHPNHTVTGNPDRLRSGETLIRGTDDSWRTQLPIQSKAATVAMSWPLMGRYGYSRINFGRRVATHDVTGYEREFGSGTRK